MSRSLLKSHTFNNFLSFFTLFLLLGAIFLTFSNALQKQDTRSNAEEANIITATPTPSISINNITPTLFIFK